MKTINALFAGLLLTASVCCTQQANAQAPQHMSYQSVIRNSSNALVAATPVSMQISLLQGTTSGTAVYVETQTATTNANGLVSIEIGTGTVTTGTFSEIDWSTGPYFIKTEIDPAGGSNYTITGTQQVMSVPYALYAKNGITTAQADEITAQANAITAMQAQLNSIYATLSTVTIGSQIWTSTNLNVTTYRDGTPIPEVQDPAAWANLTTGAWCHLNNDPANDAIYGKMYNHYAVEDPRGLAPVGYHIPTFAEYDTLIQTLPAGVCGGATWSNAFALMSSGFYNGTNISGFSALNGGERFGDAIDFGLYMPAGSFDSNYTAFWSSDPAGSYNYIILGDQCAIGSTERASNHGAYIRLIKN